MKPNWDVWQKKVRALWETNCCDFIPSFKCWMNQSRASQLGNTENKKAVQHSIKTHTRKHSLSSGLLSPPLSSLCRRCLCPESPSPRNGVSGCVYAGASSLLRHRCSPSSPACPPCRDYGSQASVTPRPGGARWMPRPADSRARSGGWWSSRRYCPLRVFPSSERSAHLSGSPNVFERTTKCNGQSAW